LLIFALSVAFAVIFNVPPKETGLGLALIWFIAGGVNSWTTLKIP
jgi:hypothetical protein